MTQKISVLIAEDHQIVREGLRALLEVEDDIEVIAEAQTGREAVQLTRKLCPNVVLMDIAMPQLNGLEAIRRILKAAPDTRVLVLSAHGDDEYIRQVILLGASGYLLKQTSADVLSQAIRQVQQGYRFYSPSIACRVDDLHLEANDIAELHEKKKAVLSSREVEILQLVAEGKANKQVAHDLGISIKTVEKHRQKLMVKLDLHDTAGLTRYAIAAGIIESSVQQTVFEARLTKKKSP